MNYEGLPAQVASWGPQALQLFADELAELETLSKSQLEEERQTHRNWEERHSVEVDALLQAEYPDLFQNLTVAASGDHGASHSSLPVSLSQRVVKKQKTKQAQQQLQAELAAVIAKRDALLQKKNEEARVEHLEQPWQRLSARDAEELERTRRLVRRLMRYESRELERFTSRPLSTYSLGEVLQGQQLDAEGGRHGSAAGFALPAPPSFPADGTGAVSSRQGTGKKGRPARHSTSLTDMPKSSRGRPPSVTKGSRCTTKEMERQPITAVENARRSSVDELGGPTTAPFLIDARGFAQEYNDMLVREFGYRPVLTNSISGGNAADFSSTTDPVARAADEEVRRQETLKSKLRTHNPGWESGDVANHSSLWLPPIFNRGPCSPVVLKDSTADAYPQEAACALQDHSSALTYPLPCTIRGAETDPSPRSPRQHDSGKGPEKKKKLASTVNTLTTAIPGAGQGSSSLSPPLPSVLSGIECSVRGGRLSFSSCINESATATVRFVSRNAYRTRLRLRGATHPWLSYECRCIAPAAGAERNFSSPVPVESPLNCGGYIDVEVVFHPTSAEEPVFDAVLEIGVTRELNSRSGSGATWEFYRVAVHCETVLPAFRLLAVGGGETTASVSASQLKKTTSETQLQLSEVVFPEVLLLSTTTQTLLLENIGSYAVVNLWSNSTSFSLLPNTDVATPLPHCSTMPFSITFCPLSEGFCEATLSVIVRESAAEGSAVIAEHTFPLSGIGVVPQVEIVQLGGQPVLRAEGRPQWRMADPTWKEGPLNLQLADVSPLAPSQVEVVVRNGSPIGLPYHWQGEVSRGVTGNDANGAVVSIIVPAHGTLPPRSEVLFIITFAPRVLHPVVASWNLLLEEMPNVVVSPPEVNTPIDTILSLADSDTLAFYARGDKLLPSAQYLGADGKNLYMDPVLVFQQAKRDPAEMGISDVFATGLLLYAQPVAPSISLNPAVIEESIECLVRCTNTRVVTLVNHSPAPLQFAFDPSMEMTDSMLCSKSLGALAVDSPSVRRSVWEQWVSHFPQREGIEAQCQPSRGTIAAHSSLPITVEFTVQSAGLQHGVVRCFFLEVEALRASLRLAASGAVTIVGEASPLEGNVEEESGLGYYAIQIAATGVGPTVQTSTELLDFGLIELGQEAAASFTVTNNNPIPVVFDLCDPLMRHPPRFVFIPESFRLGAGVSIEVTVYRKAQSIDDAQTFFELMVRDGGTSIAIETRATIQQPTLMLEDTAMHLGTVPEAVWQTTHFYVLNRSALNTSFTLRLATPPSPYIAMEFGETYRLHAGERLAVPLRCRYFAAPAEVKNPHRYRALLKVVSNRSHQELLAELCCDAVERLHVSADLLPLRAGSSDLTPQGDMPVDAYISALLWNSLEEALLSVETQNADLTGRTDKGTTVENPMTRFVRPYCMPAHVQVRMPNDVPICAADLMLRLQNYTGCEGQYTTAALHYIPLPTQLQRGRRNKSKRQICPPRAEAAESQDDWMKAYPAFWTVARHGSETQGGRSRRFSRDVQLLLMDGRGCATRLSTDLSSGSLSSQQCVSVPVQLLSSLPGCYEETVQLGCRGVAPLPAMQIPITYEVFGRPIVLDATTAGLTRDGDDEVLIMPSVIAPLGTSRRSLRLVNRIPRDVDVTVEVFPCSSIFSVHAVDPDAPASDVVLQLGPMTAEDKEREGRRFGHVAAVPYHLCIPSQSRREVIIEYTPNNEVTGWHPETEDVAALGDTGRRTSDGGEQAASTRSSSTLSSSSDGGGAERSISARKGKTASGAGAISSHEVMWHGSVCIYAQLANTEFNDIFIIDEFYNLHSNLYPSTRTLSARFRSQGGGTGVGSTTTGGAGPSSQKLLSVAQLEYFKPIRHRPTDGVVRNGRVRWPTAAEQHLIESFEASAEAAVPHRACSHSTSTFPVESSGASLSRDSDSDDESDDGGANEPFIDPGDLKGKKSLEVLMAEAEERRELLTYLDARRAQLLEESKRYFTPIELRLQVRCGVPQLLVEPSSRCVMLPPLYYLSSNPTPHVLCRRTIRLTNQNSAPLRFHLRVVDDGCFFRIANCTLLRTGVEEDLLTDPLASAVERTLEKIAPHLSKGALLRKKAPQLSTNGKYAAVQEEWDATKMYTLRTMDSLDVMVELYASDADLEDYFSVGTLRDSSVAGLGANQMASQKAATALRAAISIQYTRLWSPSITRGTSNAATVASTAALTSEVSKKVIISSEVAAAMGIAMPDVVDDTDGSDPGIIQQLIPLAVAYVAPSVECFPSSLWFRPGVIVHDGRAQSSYGQKLLIYNKSPHPLPFRIHAVRAADVLGPSCQGSPPTIEGDGIMDTTAAPPSPSFVLTAAAALSQSTRMQRTAFGHTGFPADLSFNRKVQSVTEMPALPPPDKGSADLLCVDDPQRFLFSCESGVLPAASAGAVPGRFEVLIRFTEHSNVRYESVFEVEVTGVPHPTYVVLRGDSRETEV